MSVGVLFFAVEIPVKQWKSDKKGYTDQIFNPFDVLVIIYQCKNLFYLSD